MAQYTTTEKVESEIRAESQFSSTTSPSLNDVTSWIEQESAYIDTISGTSFSSIQTTVDLDYNGEDELIALPDSPILTFSKLSYSTSAIESGLSYVEKVEDTDYTVYKETGEVALLSGFSPAYGRKRFQVEYTYGYTDIPAQIEMLASKLVANRVLNTLLSSNVETANAGGSVSVGSISIVEPADVGVGTYRQLQTDINTLKKEILSGFKTFRYRDILNG